MKKALLWILVFFPTGIYANTFTEIKVSDTNFKYVTYNIGNENYSLKVATSENAVDLETLARQNNGITAINGVFFCPEDYSECGGNNYTINERFVNGEDISFYEDTGERGVFAWDKDMTPFIFKTNYINSEKRADIFEGMGNFPILLSAGKNQITYYDAVGLLDKKMKNAMPRHFICSNKEKTEIIFGETSSISLENLANLLPNIGCYDALNLDAGLSSYFIYNGRNLTTGSRKIIDGFIITSPNIDVREIENRLDNAFESYFGNYTSLPSIQSLKKLKAYREMFISARKKIYENNSIDLFNESGLIIGYKIDIKDIKTQKNIYIINSFEKRLSRLEKRIKNEN